MSRRWGAKAQLISRRDPSSCLLRPFLPGSAPGSRRVLARQLGWQGKEGTKLTTKPSVLEITRPQPGRQEPPCGC